MGLLLLGIGITFLLFFAILTILMFVSPKASKQSRIASLIIFLLFFVVMIVATCFLIFNMNFLEVYIKF